MKYNYMIFALGASLSWQIIAMEPEKSADSSKEQGWGAWTAVTGLCQKIGSLAAKSENNAVRIHIWDMKKKSFVTINSEAVWIEKVRAFVVSEEYMAQLQIAFPGKEFYCNKPGYIARLAEYFGWQYRLVTVTEKDDALKNNTVFEGIYCQETDEEYKIVDIDRPEQSGVFFHANQNLPLGYWYKTIDSITYKVTEERSEQDKIVYRRFSFFQAQ